jgi:hypothetical protein
MLLLRALMICLKPDPVIHSCRLLHQDLKWPLNVEFNASVRKGIALWLYKIDTEQHSRREIIQLSCIYTIWFWLDHLTSKFELFWLGGFLKRFSKTSPLKQMKKFFTLLWPLITPEDHELNKIDSAVYQEALV